MPELLNRLCGPAILCLIVALAATPSLAAAQGAAAEVVRELETATAALQKGDLGRAEAAARAALAVEKSDTRSRATALNILGIVKDQQLDAPEAEKLFRKALALLPGFVAARNNLANLLYKTRREREAKAQFRLVLRSDPNHTESNLNLGLIHKAEGQKALAIRHLERARINAAGDPKVMLTLAGLYFETKQETLALKAIEDLLGLSGADVRVHFTAGLLLARHDHSREAADRFRFVVERQPGSYEALYNYGLALFNLGRLDEAERALAAAADMSPQLADTHFRLALVYSAAGNSQRAIEEFIHAIERDTQKPEAHFLLAEEYAKHGRINESYTHYERAVELSPITVPYLLRLGEVCFKLYRYQRAEDAYRRALEASAPRSGELNYLVGYAARAQGKFTEAVDYFKKELAINPNHVESLANIGFVQIEMGQFELAEKHLLGAARLKPNHVAAFYDLGRLYLRLKRYEEAETALARVIELRPDHTQAHYQLFLIYARTKRPELAQRVLELFEKLEADDRREREARDRRQGVGQP